MKGVNIEPINAWLNGESVIINYFTQVSVNDNLDSFAVLSYQMQNINDTDPLNIVYTTINTGFLTIDGLDYLSWSNNPNANAWIYNWSLEKLNLTAIP